MAKIVRLASDNAVPRENRISTPVHGPQIASWLPEALEVIGAIAIAIGLAMIYLPLLPLWGGAVCFAGSYLAELRQRDASHAERQPGTRDPDDVDDQELEPELAEVIPPHVRTTKGGLVKA
jgi:hypothetical protein